MMERRSAGVTVFALLIIVGGVAGLLVNFNYLAEIADSVGPDINSLRIFLAVCQILLAVSLFYGMGILWLKEWARAMAVVVNIAVLIIYPALLLILRIPGSYIDPLAVAISLGFPIAIIYFFSLPKVKEQFKQK